MEEKVYWRDCRKLRRRKVQVRQEVCRKKYTEEIVLNLKDERHLGEVRYIQEKYSKDIVVNLEEG